MVAPEGTSLWQRTGRTGRCRPKARLRHWRIRAVGKSVLREEFRARRVRLGQVSGVGEIPTMRNVWVIYIIAILAVVLAAAWIIFVQPHFHLDHG
jgi:hypothetical protein